MYRNGTRRYRNILLIFWLVYWIIAYFSVVQFFSVRNVVYRLLTPYLGTQEDNLVFFDYYVYGTERRFNEGLEKDIPKAKELLKLNNEGVVIKIEGEDDILSRGDYLLIRDHNVPEFNIEVYVAKNIFYRNMSIPFPTAVHFLEYHTERIIFWVFICCIVFVFSFGVRAFILRNVF